MGMFVPNAELCSIQPCDLYDNPEAHINEEL
jgi:hypothetical protein